MQILNLIKSHKPVFSISFCVFTLCCRIIYKLSCFSHWFEAHTQDNPTLPNAFTLSEKGQESARIPAGTAKCSHLFLCAYTTLSSAWAPGTTPWRCAPLLKVYDLKTCSHTEPVPEEQKAQQRVWMWLQTGPSLGAGGTGYLWQQSAPRRALPWENQETNAMTTGISFMLSRSAQGVFLTFFLIFTVALQYCN